MLGLNYFQVLCFAWAALGIGSRVAMAVMGERWNQWEVGSAYGEQRPGWIYMAGIITVVVVGVTWYQVFATSVAHSWLVALLVSLTAAKVYALLFRYDEFRDFVARSLNSSAAMWRINGGVLSLSLALVVMGLFLYA